MLTKRRPLRGIKLDTALAKALETMLEQGLECAPINISSVTKRLALGSRNSLSTRERKAKIHAAMLKQRAGLGSPRDRKTRDILLQLDRMKAEREQMREDLNNLRVQLAQVAINAHKLGYNPEKLLEALRDEKKNTDAPEKLWLRYLRKIGLLEKLDSNVRKFVV